MARLPDAPADRMVRAYSSVVEHYVDIVGVASSILATPTIRKGAAKAALFSFYGRFGTLIAVRGY